MTPQRYEPTTYPSYDPATQEYTREATMEPSDQGQWVRYEDYAELLKQIEGD